MAMNREVTAAERSQNEFRVYQVAASEGLQPLLKYPGSTTSMTPFGQNEALG